MNYHTIFESLTHDPRYLAHLDWGEAREGHPEGTIRAHIEELERNLDQLRPKLSEEECIKLKILIHTHDTFKSLAKPGVAITDDRSHASLARAFLAEFCNDADLLAMVQFHDEPYALWRQAESKNGPFNQVRFTGLLNAIQDWNLFLAFLLIDGCTEGKDRESLVWFFEQVDGKVPSNITAGDIL